MDSESYLPEAVAPEKHKPRFLALAAEVLQTVALAGVFYIIISLLTARVVVEGPSMRPTLLSGEWIVVNRWAYKVGSPQRGDVIVFLPPTDAQTDDLIKRVIGLPGEELEIRGGSVWIDGALLEEEYISGITSSSDDRWQLRDDELFVMGDNRGLSLDSRSFGPVSIRQVVGKAWLIYWPPAEWGPLDWRTGAEASAEKASFRYNSRHPLRGCDAVFFLRGACTGWELT
jgi:signal peptidase I